MACSLLAAAFLAHAGGCGRPPSTERFAAPGNIIPTELRCEYALNPVGIDTPRPRFCWVLWSARRGQVQSAYQILVAGDHGERVWDSGQVTSRQSIQVEYDGAELQSGQRYTWRVRVWDGAGRASAYSRTAAFEMGLLHPGDWKARWIARKPEQAWAAQWRARKTQERRRRFRYEVNQLWDIYRFGAAAPLDPAPLLRKEFILASSIERARLYVCGLGYYEVRINGRKVGDRVMDPARTNYDRRVLYASYDVTRYLRAGRNAVGVMLGRGWYNVITHTVWGCDRSPWTGQPKLILQMEIRLADGTSLEILSDQSWKVADSPILFDDVRSGEIYDAREERRGWDGPGYDDSGWDPACPAPAPRGGLAAQVMQPIKVVSTVRPQKLTNPSPGVYIYDMGQNMAGWARLRAEGPRGTRVVLTFAERLRPDGALDARSGAERYQQAIYVLKGEGIEEYEPRFTYYGFQYVQVTGFPGVPTLQNLQGRPVHSAVEPVGEFVCSNPLINRIHQNVRWTQLNNLHDIPTDCPHREKLGWTGDAHLTAEEAIYNFDMALFYTKWLKDLACDQSEDGELPAVSPSNGWRYAVGPTWTSAYVIIPWYLYQYYGDRRILEEHYQGMKRWVDSIERTYGVKEHLVPGPPGDWRPPDRASPLAPEGDRLLGTGYYYYATRILSRIAGVLRLPLHAVTYSSLAGRIQNAFNRKFLAGGAGKYQGDVPTEYRQTSNACPLFLGIVPAARRPAVVRNLVQDITSRRRGHLNTGVVGTKLLLEILPELGYPEVAYRIVTQRTYPGWGWQIERGATSGWEDWDGRDSRDHIMFGSVDAYFYKTLAGIRPDPAGPGFERIIIKPYLEGDLSFVKASLKTVRGVVASNWRKRGKLLTLEVTIPVNSTASVSIPRMGSDRVSVQEGGNIIWDGRRYIPGAEGVMGVTRSGDYLTFQVGSGSYRFQARPTR